MINMQSQPQIALDESDIAGLEASLRGELVRPTDRSYDSVRKVWNGMIDKRPALIVRARSAQDVSCAIQFARTHDLPIAVRGGGHSMSGLSVCDGGMMIDLSLMKGITADPRAQTARAEPGLLLGELIRATEPLGLVTTTGVMSETGISGLTLGGGLGWLAGKYGLTCDNVLSFDVVTADGELRHASAEENSDLYWALRGGGGNFGIVTSFEYRLHPLAQVLGGMIVHPLPRGREVLSMYRDFAPSCPDELTIYAALLTSPDGHPAVGIGVCYAGPVDEGERVIAPLRRFGSPIADMVRPIPYSQMFNFIDSTSPTGRSYYERASALKELSDGAIDALVTSAETRTSPFAMILIQQVHGAAARVPVKNTAFALRQEHFEVSQVAGWDEQDGQKHIDWVKTASQRLEPYAGLGVYVNFLGREGRNRIKASYGPNYDRLVALKNKYDPSNLFHLNQNIQPTVAEEW